MGRDISAIMQISAPPASTCMFGGCEVFAWMRAFFMCIYLIAFGCCTILQLILKLAIIICIMWCIDSGNNNRLFPKCPEPRWRTYKDPRIARLEAENLELKRKIRERREILDRTDRVSDGANG